MPDQRFSDADYRQAWALYWQARRLAGASRIYPRPGPLAIPPEWTAWLLMDKAGVPRPLIAYTFKTSLAPVEKRLRLARMLMLFAPYAAKVELLMQQMTRFEPGRSVVAMEGACAGQR